MKSSKIKSHISRGAKHEMEHVSTIRKIKNNPRISTQKAAELIAKDHLKDDPKYYEKLEIMKMEKGSRLFQQHLIVGKKYEWLPGAEYQEVTYVGTTRANPEIKAFSSIGKGLLFQFEDGKYVEIGRPTLYQGETIREIEQMENGKKIIQRLPVFKEGDWVEVINEEDENGNYKLHGKVSGIINNPKHWNVFYVVSFPVHDNKEYTYISDELIKVAKKGDKIKSFLTPEMLRNTDDLVSVKSDYPRKSAEWIWDNWINEQRIHFLSDHHEKINLRYKKQGHKNTELNSENFYTNKYNELPEAIQYELSNHIQEGRYADGDKISGQKRYEALIEEAEKITTIDKIGINSWSVQITPYNTDQDAYTPKIEINKSELLSLAIASFIKDGHSKEDIKAMIDYLFDKA